MPVALIIVGLVMIVVAWRGTQGDLAKLLANDFTGKNNFLFWLVVLFILSLVGYIPKAKPIAIGFMTLVIVTIIVKRGESIFNAAGESLNLTQQ